MLGVIGGRQGLVALERAFVLAMLRSILEAIGFGWVFFALELGPILAPAEELLRVSYVTMGDLTADN
jgi:hypothetical protein